MRNLETKDGAIDPSSLWLDLQDLESGEITPERREKLIAVLDSSKEARKLYFEYFEQAALLQEEAKVLTQSEAMPLWQDRTRRSRFLVRTVMAAAAALLVSALVVTYVSLTAETPRLYVTASSGTVWEGGSQQGVSEGSTVTVLSGNLSLRSASGLEMIIEGPSIIAFPEINRPLLKEGVLWVDSSAHAGDFCIDTGHLLISDIGTRFGVVAQQEGGAEVHLVSGLVDVALGKTGVSIATMDTSGSGLAVSKTGKIRAVSLRRDPFENAPEIFSERSGYYQVLTGQHPAGYWRFSEPGDRGAIVPAQGLTYGFGTGNTCLDLRDGEVPDIAAQPGLSTREGSLSLWVRRENDLAEPETLWVFPQDSRSLTLRVLADGTPAFHVAQGDNSLVLKGDRKISDGEWHHLVLTWSFEKTEMFLDAKPIAKGYGVRTGGAEVSGVPFRLDPSFHGLVDELAVWPRALTPAEVSAQYGAVRNIENAATSR